VLHDVPGSDVLVTTFTSKDRYLSNSSSREKLGDVMDDAAVEEPSSDDNDNYGQAARRLAWENSPEYRKTRRINIIGSIAIGAFILIEYLALSADTHTSFFSVLFSNRISWRTHWQYLLGVFIFATMVGIASGAARSRQERLFDDRQLVAAQASLEGAESRLAQTGDLDLPSLWKVTHQRLDYYHEIVTRQARQSFRNAQLAMAIGLLILIAATTVVLLELYS